MVDFHTHSNFSDGDFSPSFLVKEAAKQGLRAIALTDHDTIKGLESARTAAIRENIYFIPGIEININWTGGKTPHGASGLGPGGEFHLLGLGLNKPSTGFIDAVDKLSHRREERNREILDRMCELNMTIQPNDSGYNDNQASMEATWKELLSISGQGMNKDGGYSLGRLHFAAFLVKHKFVRNTNQAFAHYLGAGKPLFVPKEGLLFDEAAALIRESGGIPVLAHPISLYIAWGRLPDMIKTLKNMGLMGLEAWHPTAKSGSCRRLEELAKSLGLYVTEGSDFHGSVRPERKLGYSSKGRKISDNLFEAIPELTQHLSA